MVTKLLSQVSATQSQNQTVESSAWDEMTDSTGQIRAHWQNFGPEIQSWNTEEKQAMSAVSSGMIADLGTTYNVYSDAGAAGQPFQLDPIPLIIPPSEWTQISEGLAQRTRLLDAVLADLYSNHTLLKEGLIPPDLLYSSPSFLHCSRSIQPPGGRYLVTTGCDLVRSSSGEWKVLQDHTSSPGGLGQVMENRNVVSSIHAKSFDTQGIARLGVFFEEERLTLQSLLPVRGRLQNVVFLTPGFRHPSYFEHAYKARLYGFPLVEPADLTVREKRLFLKTLGGLRRIDAVACRLGDDQIDPLEHWGSKGIGVPGIVEAWRTGNVAMANAPGAGFASTQALMPFLPGICRKWFGEEIKLPFVETWWLNQESVRKRVLEQLNRFVLLSAFGRDSLLPIRCSSLSLSARKQWIAAIEERPYDFVAQLDVQPSEAPALEGKTIRQRPIVWRAFTLLTNHEPKVLPGGLVRVGKHGQAPQLWPAHAGFTKDVWISESVVDSGNESEIEHPRPTKDHHPSALEVQSRIAEQLFWVGRSAERIELATRLLRATLKNLSGETGRLQKEQLTSSLKLMRGVSLLTDADLNAPENLQKKLTDLIHQPSAYGSIARHIRSLIQNAAAARDRLSDDTWRFFNRLEGIVHTPTTTPTTADLLRTLDTLVLHLSAFSGMQAENMTRGQGWRFLEVGRRVERALSVLKLLGSVTKEGKEDCSQLDALLETCDSVMTYRRRHFSRPRLDGVVDLIYSDANNPRSVAYQISVISREISSFSGDPEFGLMPVIREHLAEIHLKFSDMPDGYSAKFSQIFASLEVFADMIMQHYFSHSVRRVY